MSLAITSPGANILRILSRRHRNYCLGVKVGRGVFAIGVLAAIGCGSGGGVGTENAGPPSFPPDALTTAIAVSGNLTIAVRTSPQPPTRGLDFVQYAVTDKTGAPVDGLGLTIVPWMPADGHGTSIAPVVVPRGAGIYEIDNVDLFMAGHWELRSAITAAPDGDDSVVPSVDVQ
jgi:hypothetical protein